MGKYRYYQFKHKIDGEERQATAGYRIATQNLPQKRYNEIAQAGWTFFNEKSFETRLHQAFQLLNDYNTSVVFGDNYGSDARTGQRFSCWLQRTVAGKTLLLWQFSHRDHRDQGKWRGKDTYGMQIA
jgi:hypothetical protein